MRTDKETQDRHTDQFRYFISEITRGLELIKEGKWNIIDYEMNMIEVAEKIRLPYQDILEMKQKLKDLLEETK